MVMSVALAVGGDMREARGVARYRLFVVRGWSARLKARDEALGRRLYDESARLVGQARG